MKTIDFINLIGTFCSIGGLIFVIIQIKQVKGIAVAARDASEKTRTRINEILFAMDIPKALKIVTEIQGYNRNSKFEMSILRMQDLKYHLTQVKNNDKYSVYIDKQEYSGFITDISVEINNLEKVIKNSSSRVDTIKLNALMEIILNVLSEIDTTVKKEGGKSDI